MGNAQKGCPGLMKVDRKHMNHLEMLVMPQGETAVGLAPPGRAQRGFRAVKCRPMVVGELAKPVAPWSVAAVKPTCVSRSRNAVSAMAPPCQVNQEAIMAA